MLHPHPLTNRSDPKGSSQPGEHSLPHFHPRVTESSRFVYCISVLVTAALPGCSPDHPTIHHRHEPLPPTHTQHHHASHPGHPHPHLTPPYAQFYALAFTTCTLSFSFFFFSCSSLHLHFSTTHTNTRPFNESPPFVTRAELHPNQSLPPPSHTITKASLTSPRTLPT